MSDPLDQLRAHFTGLRLRVETPTGRVYAARDLTGTEVTIAVLVGAAATDLAVRARFAEVVWHHSVGAPPGRATVTVADLHAVFPWAAAQTPAGQIGAEQLLAGLAGASPLGLPASASGLPASAPGLPASAPVLPPGPIPAGGSWRARLNRSGSPWPWLLGAAGGVLLVLVAAGVIAGVQAVWGEEPGGPAAGSTGSPPAGVPGAPGGADPDLAQLRAVEPIRVLGATFGPEEQTDTMAFVGWPFAFRTPPDWECFEERLERIPDGELYQCEDGEDPNRRQLAVFLLWACPTTCTEGEQQEMLEAWLDQPDWTVQLEPVPTAYVETGRNRDGNYTVDLGHFAGSEPGGPLRWLVGAYIESPVETRADVQKILNDVISQSTH